MTTSNTSIILTEKTVPTYLAKYASEIGIFQNEAKLSCKKIVGGNVNYAFCVIEEGTDKTVFVKQAPEFVAIFGPDGLPLTSERMKQEIAVFSEWKDLLGPDLCAKYLPKIYKFDTKMMVFVMEFLDEYTLLDHDLVEEGNVHNTVNQGLGEFMGKTHAATHSSKISESRFDFLKKNFENRPMRDIQNEYVFTKCYKESTNEQRAGLEIDDAFMKEVENLKASYNGSCENNLSLCHGDLHPGSVMVRGSCVKVIDPEFTVYGPPGLDVGSLLSGYILGAVHQSFSSNPAAVNSIIKGIEVVWNAYSTEMMAGGISKETLLTIESETVGYALAEVCRTALEFAGGRKWLQFEDQVTAAESKKTALTIVGKCMTKRHTNGMKLLLFCMKELLM